MKQALLIFTKNLIFGKVKTRLAATIGNDRALSVYQLLLKHAVAITHYLPVDKIVFYSDYIEEQDMWDKKVYKKQDQLGDDLGERMQNAFSYAFTEGYEKAVIIGTDCLELNSSIILDAFNYLSNHDVVIGPALDGGYYLLGMKKLHDELFKNISWSTEEVFKQTKAICGSLSLVIYLLPELSDIDTESDLKKVQEQLPLLKKT